ncbi:MAG: PHP domain-containing protein, partial [Planctomycetaceae bacterium]|nr:PHP domain-containing protein [Planctomycetaceae bacterium]
MFSTTSSGGQGKQVGIVLLFCAALCQLGIASEPIVIQSGERLVHLRSGGGPDAAPEWTEFAESTPIEKLDLTFQSSFIDADLLEIHQQDVKQAWKVRLNDTPLEPLPRDENDLVISLPVPEGALREGENRLTIEGPADAVDDIRLGQIRLHPRAEKPWLQQCQLTVHVTDKSTREATPCRLTILNSHGALQTVHVPLRPLLAVRPGVIYAGDGDATFSLPAGEYTIFAGRGFEYSLAQQSVQLTAGDSRSLDLSIEREVSTTGYVACDTHVHTLTHSGHGDCSIEERMVTLAGEGIELAIATDHNKQIDYRPAAQELGLLRHFTPVIGNEVTTKTGHFNMFPLPPIEPRPDHTFTDWGELGAEFDRHSEAQVIILNHARDLHSGVRPFGPLLFNAVIGTRFDGQPIPANAMEVINSGA